MPPCIARRARTIAASSSTASPACADSQPFFVTDEALFERMSLPASFDPAVERYVNLATYRRNGAEVRTPVWIAGEGDRYYVFSAGEAGKVKRIRVTPRVRLAACDMRGEL